MNGTVYYSRKMVEYRENYKMYGGFKYHLSFPDEWMTNEYPFTGRECANCVGETVDGYAMWRGLIIGYCANCAEKYHGKRGPGFVGCGVEAYMENAVSAYRLYLGELSLKEPENDTDEEDEWPDWEQTHIKEKLDIFDQMEATEDDDEYPEYELEDDPICCISTCKKYAEHDSQYCYTHSRMKKRSKTSTKGVVSA